MNVCPLRLIGELIKTYQNGHSITKVDWGGHDPSLYSMDGCMLSEVDWGAHDSSFFLYLVHIDYDAKPKEFFTQGLWRGLPQRTSSTPLIQDFSILDKLRMDVPTPNESRDIEVHTLFLTLNTMKVAIIYLLNGILGRTFATSTLQEGKHK